VKEIRNLINYAYSVYMYVWRIVDHKNMTTHLVFYVLPDRIDFLNATALDKMLDFLLVKSSKDSFFMFVIFSFPKSCIKTFLLQEENKRVNSYIMDDIAQK
jgi:hypothetical protein